MTVPTTFKNLLFYIDRCKIHVIDGNVVFDKTEDSRTYNIPYANISILMTGPETSITNCALNKLSEENVTIVSVSNNFNSHTVTLPSQPGQNTKYFHKLIQNLYIDNKRVEIAKNMLIARSTHTKELYIEILVEAFGEEFLDIVEDIVKRLPEISRERLEEAYTIDTLLGIEGDYMKKIRNVLRESLAFNGDNNEKEEDFQKRLKIGNSFTYGMSSTVIHALGVTSQMNVFHGRTNAGALKYDIADLVKTIVYITAMFSLSPGMQWTSDTPEEYVKKLGEYCVEKNILKKLFDLAIETLEIE